VPRIRFLYHRPVLVDIARACELPVIYKLGSTSTSKHIAITYYTHTLTKYSPWKMELCSFSQGAV
jgi:seryl-tRNA(Sec) selenium transferase